MHFPGTVLGRNRQRLKKLISSSIILKQLENPPDFLFGTNKAYQCEKSGWAFYFSEQPNIKMPIYGNVTASLHQFNRYYIYIYIENEFNR